MINMVSTEASANCLIEFSQEVTQNIIDGLLEVNSIYNIYKELFGKNISTKMILYIKGSNNVWGKSVEDLFHITIFPCVGASNHATPPPPYFHTSCKDNEQGVHG